MSENEALARLGENLKAIASFAHSALAHLESLDRIADRLDDIGQRHAEANQLLAGLYEKPNPTEPSL